MTPPTQPNVWRSDRPVRALTAEELNVGADVVAKDHGSNRPDDPKIESNDPIVAEIISLLPRYGGVILTGPPGTSKSWYAAKATTVLTEGDESRSRYVQFHPSYQYEDFVQGFRPTEDGGFELADRTLMELCRVAEKAPEKLHVLVIDELSRGEPGRVFGEALTYIEKSKRTLPFTLASGQIRSIPRNIFVIATMNPLDKGVDEVDAAFERRFAKIAMDPDRFILERILADNGLDAPLARRVVGFFDKVNGLAARLPQAAIGHTFFVDVVDEDSLRSAWKYQLRFIFERALRFDADTHRDIVSSWDRVFPENLPPVDVVVPDEKPDQGNE
ncbi:McrB family protein [Pseudonocardia lutea]|uniref:McrB family protein n=1 Tax=Pseudonocardia lutea TaxID=2172015 RepID=A0ABW1IC02_9PSEU